MKKNWKSNDSKQLFQSLYGAQADRAPLRYEAMENKFFGYFGEGPYRVFSAPGRSEIGGNHTDHNYGKVLACAVSVDTVAFVRATEDMTIRYRSEGYCGEQEFSVNISDLSVSEKEYGSTNALIRGVAARMFQLGFRIGGFDMYVSSGVLKGSGLSSSAAFEVLTCAVLDGMYNDGKMDPVLRAQIAQYAENRYFGKPSGLMDQVASSVGALVTIDFEEPGKPQVERVEFDFAGADLFLVVVDTGGSHADLTDAYASITEEMGDVASYFGKSKLREVGYARFKDHLADLPGKVSDRAILRAIHFFDENDRVDREVAALKNKDIRAFLNNVIDSGDSSWKLLQNVYVGGSKEQGLALALAVSKPFLEGQGAWRVHGGGFAGTIQAFVPGPLLQGYVQLMNHLFRKEAATVLSIRQIGALEIRI